MIFVFVGVIIEWNSTAVVDVIFMSVSQQFDVKIEMAFFFVAVSFIPLDHSIPSKRNVPSGLLKSDHLCVPKLSIS